MDVGGRRAGGRRRLVDSNVDKYVAPLVDTVLEMSSSARKSSGSAKRIMSSRIR